MIYFKGSRIAFARQFRFMTQDDELDWFKKIDDKIKDFEYDHYDDYHFLEY